MEVIILLLLVAMLNGAIILIDEMLDGLVTLALYADEHMLTASGSNMVDVLFEIVLGFGVSLIILVFLKKGFECYVMWTDGDPDTDPMNLMIRFIQAIVIAVSFPILYGWLASVTEELTEELVDGIGAGANYDWQVWVSAISSAGIVTAIFGIIFVICYFILYFQFLMRGLEIMILRIGMPIACVGLLDSNKGVFADYMKIFIKSMVTIMVQICLCKLGVSMMLNMSTFWGIACMSLAIKTPQFIAQFIVQGGGSGASGAINNVYHSVRLIQVAKGLR